MKIYTEVVYQFNKKTNEYELVSEQFYEYEGEIAEAKGGGGGSQTTVQKADPWEGQQPYLKKGFEKAEELFLNKPAPQYYAGNTVVPFSPETETALNLTTQRALMGSPLQAAANNQLTGTLNGDYLYGGAGFNAAVDAATRKAMPQINSQFERAGAFNSGLADVAKTQAVADAFASQYGDERANQQRAMLFAPQMMQQDYNDFQTLANVGAQREALSQAQLAEDVNRFNYNQLAPRQNLSEYMNLIQGNYGGTQTSTSPLYRNQGAGFLGGAMSGAGLANSLGATMGGAGLMGPMGLAGGAILGGLLGGFF